MANICLFLNNHVNGNLQKMFENSGEYFRTVDQSDSNDSDTKESVLYEVAIMCDKYNRVL